MNAANPAVDASAQTGRYDPTALEQRWQESWKADGVDTTEEAVHESRSAATEPPEGLDRVEMSP